MDPAALPARPREHRGDRPLEPLVCVADHQLHPREPPRHQAAQELRPEGPVLARAHIQPQDLPLAARAHADGDDHRHGEHAPILPHLEVGRIEPHIRVGPGQRAGAEARDLRVQLLAEARHLALADPVHPERLHQVVDPAGGDALHVGLLHHRRQRPLGPLARLQQAREVAAVAHPRHLQVDGAHPRVPLPLAIPVALPRPLRGPLVPLGPECWATSTSISAWPSTRTPSRRKSASWSISALRSSPTSAILYSRSSCVLLLGVRQAR